jgi:Ca-activated chloride channel family protein
MIGFEAFHFLRPAWLLLLIPAGLVVWSIVSQQNPARSWQAVISPELLKHLAIREQQRRSKIRPASLLAFLLAVGIVALAGPAWEKEPTPFTEDEAALFIVLKVTPTMLAQDIQPSRLTRAAQKISDLLDLRPGSKTGLIAYAGSAHLVMPLTSDPSVIGYFAAELNPEVMPVEGDDPVRAVELARKRLADSGLPGSVILIADSIDEISIQALANSGTRDSADVHILAMAAGPEVVPPDGSPPAPALDEDSMQRAARAGGGSLVLVTPDRSDVQRLNDRTDRSIASAPVQEGERWKDAGYYLLPLFAVFFLLFFRPGGAVALNR